MAGSLNQLDNQIRECVGTLSHLGNQLSIQTKENTDKFNQLALQNEQLGNQQSFQTKENTDKCNHLSAKMQENTDCSYGRNYDRVIFPGCSSIVNFTQHAPSPNITATAP